MNWESWAYLKRKKWFEDELYKDTLNRIERIHNRKYNEAEIECVLTRSNVAYFFEGYFGNTREEIAKAIEEKNVQKMEAVIDSEFPFVMKSNNGETKKFRYFVKL